MTAVKTETRRRWIKAEHIDRSEAWFARHGVKAVLFGRMVPMFRHAISLPAGIQRMPLPKFLLFTALGTMTWNSTLLVAGYLLGENWHLVGDLTTAALQFVVFAAVPLIIVLFVVKRIGAKRTSSAG